MAKKAKPFTPSDGSLFEAKKYLEDNILAGTPCPCCFQYVKMYRRKITTVMARTLIRLVVLNRDKPDQEYFHVRDIVKGISSTGTNDFSKMLHWKLIKPQPQEKNDDEIKGRTSGMWKITEKGIRFAMNDMSLPKIVFIFNKKVYGFSQDKINIVTALTQKFDYDELMQSE